MNSKQRKTIVAVFTEPVSATIPWSDIEKLLVSVGCEVVEGSGSRVRFAFHSVTMALHRPHGRKEAKQFQVRLVREFLLEIGVKP